MQKQFMLKRLLIANVGATLSYKGVTVTVVDDYSDPRLRWEGDDIENKIFATAWHQVQNPRYPRYVPECDRYKRFEDFDENNYEHRELKRFLFYRFKDELPSWLNRSEWRQLQKTFIKLCEKSPCIGAAWAEPYLLKLTPWCQLEYVAELIINTLNEVFMPCAAQVHFTERLVGERYTEVGIGHEDGYPLVWRQKETRGNDHEVILQDVRLREYEDGLQLRVGDMHYNMNSKKAIDRMLTRLPALVDRFWLSGLNRVKPGKICMHSLRRAVLKRNDDYDTEVFMSEGGSNPRVYKLVNKLVPASANYMSLHEETEETLKEENNG